MLYCKRENRSEENKSPIWESSKAGRAAMREILFLMAQLNEANPNAYCDACRMCDYCRQGRFCSAGASIMNKTCRKAVRDLLKNEMSIMKDFPHAEVNAHTLFKSESKKECYEWLEAVKKEYPLEDYDVQHLIGLDVEQGVNVMIVYVSGEGDSENKEGKENGNL